MMIDPDLELQMILDEEAEFERQEREFMQLDERMQMAVMLDREDDPDEAERLFAAFMEAETDEEIRHALAEMFPEAHRQ